MSRWRNGLARLQQWLCYLQGRGFESHLRPVDFFFWNKFSPLTNWAPTLTSVLWAPIIKSEETHVQHNKRKVSAANLKEWRCCWFNLLAFKINVKLSTQYIQYFGSYGLISQTTSTVAKKVYFYCFRVINFLFPKLKIVGYQISSKNLIWRW